MSDFVEYLHELFEGFGPIHAKRMFGGYGIYRDGLMFGLVADDTLYLKTDGENRACFERAGLEAFEYTKNGKVMKLSYFQAPADAMDSPDEAVVWARLAFDAALRAQSGKKPRKATGNARNRTT